MLALCPPRKTPTKRAAPTPKRRPHAPADPQAIARAHAALARECDFIHHPSFATPAADAFLLDDPQESTVGRRAKRPPGLPAYLAALYETPLLRPAQEVALFRKMNYLKYRANRLRETIDPAAPDVAVLDEHDRLLASEKEVRNRIARCNLRLVVSIARKFADRDNPFDDLVSDGNLALLQAIAKFDFGRGFRFSTYATHAVRRAFYRQMQQKRRRTSRFALGTTALLNETPDDFVPPPIDEGESRLVAELFLQMGDHLDDRERAILAARYGLDGEECALTLQRVAQRLGLCKERVRQLQNRALDKLRDLARDLRLDAQ